MRTTLELDDVDDRAELRGALEAAFSMRFSDAEASACQTVGDILGVVRSRFPSLDEGAGGCATAMAFYRVRQALSDPSARSSLVPSTRVDALAGRRGRKLLKELGRHSGLQTPRWKATFVGATGGWLLFAGLIWFLLTAVVARHLWYIGVAAGALGFVLVLLDPGRLPVDCRTLGGLARKVAGLNFGRLHAQGAKARDRDLWAALVEVLTEYTALPKTEIHSGTMILSRKPCSA